jgi:glycosyltransferase involved in cell wall biosynthesis
LKITIVQGAFLPVPAIMGGAVEKVWFALGREFAQRGHEVTHISRQHRDLPASETIDGVHCLRVAGFDAPRSLILLKALDFVYSFRVLRHLPPGDILVTNTFFLPILARDATRGKIYVHVARYPKGQMRLYGRAARLQTVSRTVADAIEREAPALAERVRVIPYPSIEDGEGSAPPTSNGLRGKELLFVGRVHPEKGLDLLIRAVSSLSREQLKGWRLVIVGPSEVRLGGGGEDYRKHLQALAAPVADLIDWIGPVFDSAELAGYYRRAAVFVYPSLANRGETFGLAPLEAMAHGCVPVVSALGCFQDYIEDRVNGAIFDHEGRQPEQYLARELAALVGDPARVATLSAAAELKSREYELGRVAELYLADFASLA